MGHTAVSAYGWGTPLMDSYGGRAMVAADAQLTQSDWVEPLDPKYCQDISDTTNSQCGAYPVRDDPDGLCAGHRNRRNKLAAKNQE